MFTGWEIVEDIVFSSIFVVIVDILVEMDDTEVTSIGFFLKNKIYTKIFYFFTFQICCRFYIITFSRIDYFIWRICAIFSTITLKNKNMQNKWKNFENFFRFDYIAPNTKSSKFSLCSTLNTCVRVKTLKWTEEKNLFKQLLKIIKIKHIRIIPCWRGHRRWWCCCSYWCWRSC